MHTTEKIVRNVTGKPYQTKTRSRVDGLQIIKIFRQVSWLKRGTTRRYETKEKVKNTIRRKEYIHKFQYAKGDSYRK